NGQFGAGKDPSKPCPCKTEGTHGNSLNSSKPTIDYTLRDLESDEIMKYGETTMGKRRYTRDYLKENNVYMLEEADGTKREMHSWQHERILEYKAADPEGRRPLLNKSDY
ncbi:hypothetical protein, partial [Pseudomonas sp. AP-1]